MRAICVDDEAILLEVLRRAVEASPDISSVKCFSGAKEALRWAESNPVDIAFLDIQLHQMNGIELAVELRQIHPGLLIVFCTGYDSYAREAFRIHASGYLSKPIHSEDVQEQIDEIKKLAAYTRDEIKRLEVRCFGNFEVFFDGKPVAFKRKKAKEIFAYMVDRKGATVSVEQLEAVLWEGFESERKTRNYIHQILYNMKMTLKAIGMEDVIISNSEGYAINKDRIECDYYHYLDNETEARNLFQGEYMYQYSWAEETCAQLMLGK